MKYVETKLFLNHQLFLTADTCQNQFEHITKIESSDQKPFWIIRCKNLSAILHLEKMNSFEWPSTWNLGKSISQIWIHNSYSSLIILYIWPNIVILLRNLFVRYISIFHTSFFILQFIFLYFNFRTRHLSHFNFYLK